MRIKKDNKIEVGRRMIKRVIKKVYLKIIKSKFGRKLRENLMPHLVAYIENEDIIIENKNSKYSQWTFVWGKANNKVESENGQVRLGLNNSTLKLVRNNDFKALVNGYSKTASFEGEELGNIEVKDAVLKISGKTYNKADNEYVLIEFSTLEDALEINTKIYALDNKSNNIKFVLVDKEYNVIFDKDLTGKINLDNYAELFEDYGELQVVCIGNGIYYPVSTTSITNNKMSVREEFSKIYISSNNNNYKFEPSKLKVKIQNIKPAYKYIERISYEASDNKFIINFNKDAKKCDKFVLYIKALKTNDREKVAEYKIGQQIIIDNVNEFLNREINLIDRYIFEFEIYGKNSKKLETNWLKLVQPKTRNVEDYVLSEAYGNVLTFFDRQILLISNKDNQYIYGEKYDFDLGTNTFTSDCNVEEKNGNIVLNFKVCSLLSKIQRIHIYLTDNYSKKSIQIDSIAIDNPERIVEGSVIIDMDKLLPYLYYNARLNFRLGVEYVGGFKETGFLVKKFADYSTKERYLYIKELDQGLVMAFYLGENQYNLNIYYTSKDECEKGIRFQTGREKYFETLKTEEVDENLIFFEANLGKNYTGNPKYLYEYMISNPKYKGYKYVWAYPDTNSKNIPGNVTLVERGTSEYFYYLAKAKYWINNIIFPVKKKREETVYLQTWHGTPLKKLGFDIECDGPEKQAFGNLYKESQNWDYFLADNDYGAEKLVNAFRFKKTLIKEGYPINDIFYNDKIKNQAIERLHRDYPAIEGKKVIVYAPTWRDLQGDYVRGYDFELPFNVEQLYEKFGDEYVVLVKLHHLIADSLEIDDKYKNFLLNVSGEEDVMQLLCIADILITDYSSVFYDFASAKKPILFYAYDLDEYINETRGLYVGMDTLPGPILQDNESLVNAIENIEQYDYEHDSKLRDFCDEMAKYCDGHSCEKVLNIVLKED